MSGRRTAPLSKAERYLIARRRLGLTQAQLAEYKGTTREAYNRFESGCVPTSSIALSRTRLTWADLAPYEACLIHRRRARFTQATVARALERSRFWINRMERGEVPCAELVEFWHARRHN